MKILFLHFSGLHLGYLGCYGNDWVATPTFDRLAAEGVVFDQHYADYFEPPSAIETGRYHFPWISESDQSATSVEARLQEILTTNQIEFLRTNEIFESELETSDAFRSSLERLRNQDGWMLWGEMPSLLPPWNVNVETLFHYFKDDVAEEEEAEPAVAPILEPPSGPVDSEDSDLMESLQLTYASAVTQADDQLSVIVKALEDAGLWNEILLIVTSDRGIALGEHGRVGYDTPWLHEEIVHLPLIVRLPGGIEAGRRIAALTQPVDLFATILDAFELPSPAHHGTSLWPLAKGSKTQERDYICAGRKVGELEVWLLRTKDWALLLPSGEEGESRAQLYEKPEDRWEVNNVFQTNFEKAEQLEELLMQWKKALHESKEFKPPPMPENDES